MTYDNGYTHKSRWRRSTRAEVLRRDRVCQGCGDPGADGHGRGLMLAHLIPHGAGGPDTASNVLLLCHSCHARFDHQRRREQSR